MLQQAVGVITMNIRDDGQGFDPERIPPGHYGLSIIRERAAAIGAKLTVTSQPGHGTEIAVRWSATSETEAP